MRTRKGENAMNKIMSANDESGYYCGVDTVMRDLQVSRSTAYALIHSMNEILLQETGKSTGIGSNKILIRKKRNESKK